jgi:hypothetical protein
MPSRHLTLLGRMVLRGIDRLLNGNPKWHYSPSQMHVFLKLNLSLAL